MSPLSNYNLEKEDVFNAIKGSCASNHPSDGIRINAVYTLCNGDWRFLIGRCSENYKDNNNLHQAYPDHVFISKTIKEPKYTDILDKLHSPEGLMLSTELPPVKIIPNSKWTHNIIPSNHSQSEIPLQRFSIGCEPQPHFWDGKLIKHGLPFHKSSTKYIKEFLNLANFHGAQDSRKGSLILDIHETRGKIIIKDGKLSIHSNISSLCIVGQTASMPEIILHPPDFHPITPQDLEDVELWLLSEDDQIVDFISSSEMPAINKPSVKIDYESIITRGECEVCEFKPYISPDSSKAEELLKATCAMSNSKGGHIFIGVSDDTEIYGITKNEIEKDYKKDSNEAINLYERDIKTKLREGLRDNQCFETRIVKIADKTVIIIQVTSSNEINYTRIKKDAYIRRGASSAKMTPEEINAYGRTHYPDYFMRKL